MLNCAKLTVWLWLNFATAPRFPVTHRRAGVQNESEHIASACTHSGWMRMRMEVMISPTFSRRSAKLRRMPIAGRRIRPGTLIPDGHTARAITHARTHAHADTHTHARTRTRTRARAHTLRTTLPRLPACGGVRGRQNTAQDGDSHLTPPQKPKRTAVQRSAVTQVVAGVRVSVRAAR
jgi:hypothetical protein